MLDSRAADTACKYSNVWQRGKTRAQSNYKLGVPILPPVPLQVVLYLEELVERAVIEGHFAYTIESASCSIRWCHRLAGMDSPTISLVVKGVVEGARRRLVRPVQPSSR